MIDVSAICEKIHLCRIGMHSVLSSYGSTGVMPLHGYYLSESGAVPEPFLAHSYRTVLEQQLYDSTVASI